MKKQTGFSLFHKWVSKTKPWYRKGSMLIASFIILFIFIGMLTTIQPAYRLSSSTLNDWTRQIKGASFLYLIGMENKAFVHAYPEEYRPLNMSNLAFQMTTSLKPNDPRSLLGRELPGFDTYDSNIIVAGEGTDYTTLPVESAAPLEVVLEEREAKAPEAANKEGASPDNKEKTDADADRPTTGDRDVVFIYNTHNRESFLPHLSEGTGAGEAHHAEVNITNVSERLAKSLEERGIGAQVDHTDIMSVLNDKGWGYGQSYEASKPVVKEALANNKDIKFVFDLHRDSLAWDVTTKEINGENYARLFFVIGGENANYEKNLKLATELDKKIKEAYPGLSRGVLEKRGAGTNGVFNQDVSENAILIEFGGVENNMEELYRTADALAEVFSEYYWQAEKVTTNP